MTKSKGKVLLELENNNIKLKRVFEVVQYEGLPLLSYEACVSMHYKMPEINAINSLSNIDERSNFIEENIDVFEGIGKFPDQVQIKITNNAIPKSNSPRRVLVKILSKLKEQLTRMLKLETIENCDNVNEWQSKFSNYRKA